MANLQVSGSPTPDVTGTYTAAGTHNGKTYWQREGDGWLIFWEGLTWWLAPQFTPGGEDPVWYKNYDPVTGTYAPYNQYASGNPIVSEIAPPPDTWLPVQVDPRTLELPPAAPANLVMDPAAQGAILEWTNLAPDMTSWYRPLSEPVWPNLWRPEGAYFWTPDPSGWPPPEVVTMDKWYRPLSEPVWPNLWRPEGAYFWTPDPTGWPPPEVVTMDKWWKPLSEPVFPPPPGPTGFVVEPLQQAAEPIPLVTRWYQPLSEPVQSTPDLGWLHQPIATDLFATRYYLDARGLFRIFNEAEYRFYWSDTGPPAEGGTPQATNATLPYTTAATFGDGTWYLSVSYFNGVLDSGFLPLGPNGETYLRLDISGGEATGSPPAGPMDWRLQARPAGVVRVWAFLYLAGGSADPDQWALSYTTDGGTPPEDTPDVTAAMSERNMAILQADVPAAAHGATVKVRLQTRRNDGTEESPSWVYSEGSTVKEITADAIGPTVPLAGERARQPGD